jgi:hypothetical protein
MAAQIFMAIDARNGNLLPTAGRLAKVSGEIVART